MTPLTDDEFGLAQRGDFQRIERCLPPTGTRRRLDSPMESLRNDFPAGRPGGLDFSRIGRLGQILPHDAGGRRGRAGCIHKAPDIGLAMLALTSQHLHRLVMQIEALKAQTGAQRVAEFLLEVCPVKAGACVISLPYDKVLIAGRLGLKPESLSRAFAKLKAHGVHVYQSKAAIDDVERVREFINEERAIVMRHSSK
jgi:hypothetical protein